MWLFLCGPCHENHVSDIRRVHLPKSFPEVFFDRRLSISRTALMLFPFRDGRFADIRIGDLHFGLAVIGM